MTKRLCIYLIYDMENIVDRYITYMLEKMKTCSEYIVVVCNSKTMRQEEKIDFYADQVIYRENLGYDAGGYKDALCCYIGWEKLGEYDELILMNDSFYGPFYPMQHVFCAMESVAADFWGLTRSQAGTEGMQYEEHIQSYFLVFKEKVLSGSAFRTFWERLEYPETMEDAVRDFELGINTCLRQNGFQGGAVSDLYKEILPLGENENPYMAYPLELIHDCQIPVLKYKALSFGNSGYSDALRAFRFIEENRLYPVEYIKSHIRRKSKVEKGWIDFEKLEKFQGFHQRLFIYGFGTYGKNLGLYFRYRGWKIEGFLVTEEDENANGATAFKRVRIEEDDGIVVAVGKKGMCMEIREYLAGQCKKGQLLFPNF